MTLESKFNIAYKNSICYSGYRKGQAPGALSPSYDEIKEDLLILKDNWGYLRLYDCTPHASTVLEVIEKESFDFKVMLGTYITAEVSNPNCPWGAIYSKEKLESNKIKNRKEIERAIELGNLYPEIIFSISVGNEATVDWSDHLVPVESVIEYAKMVKKGTKQPVTFCENYVPWMDKLEPLVRVLDFISIHTYPVWEYKSIDQAMDYTKENYYGVANRYPDTPVIITEAGWATNSNGRGIEPENVNQELQARYCRELVTWSKQNKILTFLFEAFDEEWKGSSEPLEPEKHWGLYSIERKPKLVINELF
ncbi:glycosyl hydrolase family 17 protein [Thiospirochaeta perfilievii]|uniref:glycosyl hydrolase family 17 protein n=1 Tax=Thiospirochaeta perfilievii TaxID=252967 RepID=UPI001CAA2833|nr:glycosyl hydrolase family 17 protein [Thiospirochaeta perfilievii]